MCNWAGCCNDRCKYRFTIPDGDGQTTLKFCSLEHMTAQIIKENLRREHITLSSKGEQKVEESVKDLMTTLKLWNS